jgi:hypothetical protein
VTRTRSHSRVAIAALLGVALALCTSCSTIRGMMPSQKEAKQRAIELQQVQLEVMRFADEYSSRVYEAVERVHSQIVVPEERLAGHEWRLSQSTAAYTIASGPNPIVNALDMVVLASLSRMVADDHFIAELYGERARPLQMVHERLEPQAWELVNGVLTPEQQAQLHEAIATWRQQHPYVRSVAYIHFTDFAKSVGRQPDKERAGSVFALLGLDPLSNLDPAVQEIAQTRQLAERTIYYMQRAPRLLDMQVERLTYQLAVMPETKQLLANTNRFGAAATSAGALADQVPQLVARERQAAIAQVMNALNSQQAQTRQLLTELRGALEAGTQTSDSIDGTIRSVDALVARFDKPKPAPDAAAPGKPFDISEYTATARELAGAAQQLQALLVQLDTSAGGVQNLTGSLAVHASRVVDHAFWRGVQLIVVLVAAILVAMLTYRYVTRAWARS